MIALPLRGREAELGVVVALMNGLQGGCGGVILVEGWPGIGKSRFLAEAGQLGLDAGMLLAAGRADEIEAIAPLAPLLSALSSGERPVLERQRLRALERPGDQRFWLVEELAELLELRSRETPLVISLDDLQWADPDDHLGRTGPLAAAALVASRVATGRPARPNAIRSAPAHERTDRCWGVPYRARPPFGA